MACELIRVTDSDGTERDLNPRYIKHVRYDPTRAEVVLDGADRPIFLDRANAARLYEAIAAAGEESEGDSE
jgi:hypothetical protein